MSGIVVHPKRRFAALLCFFVTFGSASSPILAFADDDSPPSNAVYFGASAGEVTVNSAGLNAQLARGGYLPMDTAAFGGAGRLDYRYERTRFGLETGYFHVGSNDDRLGGLRAHAVLELGYDAGRARGWTITPRLGTGVAFDTLCFSGDPGSIADRTSGFDRLISRPPPGVCATSASFVLRPALAVGYESTGSYGIGYRIAGVLAYTVPLTTSSWSDNWQSNLGGPSPDHGAAFFGIEIALVVGQPK
jgi:hypothetical protein